jgi:ATP-dependent helicase/nuclease subunit A
MSIAARNAELAQRDARARQLAQQVFDRPLMLEAGAGTGKTTALVARVLAWSLGPGWSQTEAALRGGSGGAEAPGADRIAARLLERVVAITFTEAAATQMGVRIGEALLAIEGEALPEGLLPEVLPESLRERRLRARALRGALDHLVVQTIHAYCRRLLVTHPLEAGLHPRLEIDADQRIQTEVVREVLEARLPDAYREPGDPAFLGLAARRIGPSEIETELLALLAEGLPASALEVDPLSGEGIAALSDRLLHWLRAFRAAAGGQLQRATRVPTAISTAECIDAAFERLQAEPLATRGQLEAFLAWLSQSGAPSATQRLAKWGRGDLAQGEAAVLGERAARLPEPAAALARLLSHLDSLDLEGLDCARGALRPLLAEVEAGMRARGAATFSDLLTRARQLLTGQPAVAARVRDRIDQLLVDEFQDTDRRQCDIIRAIALAGPEAKRPGLFLVGDPKQSIYGWRSADLAAYAAFASELRTRGGRCEPLAVNYRSAPAILQEVERVVAPVMREREGVQPAFQPLIPSAETAQQPGFRVDRFAPAEYWVSLAWDGEEGAPGEMRAREAAELEARALARDLRQLHDREGVDWNCFGVLFRSRSDWEIYLGALREAGIPFAVEGDRKHFQRREIIDAAALVRCVLDSSDHLALLTLLRSAAVGVPDAALIPLWTRGFPSRVGALFGPDRDQLAGLRELIGEAARALPDDVPGLERVRGWEASLQAAVGVLARLRESFSEDAADVFVERLRRLSLFEATEAARYLGPWRSANLDRFFRWLTDELVERGDANTVLRGLRGAVWAGREAEEGRPKEIAEDAVQVMTIHGAKGLDFSHVYLMQLHKGAGGRAGSDANRVVEMDTGFEYRLLGAATLGWDLARGERAEVEEAERVRTLYVAMTRARERLVLAGRWETEGKPRAARSQMDLVKQRRDPPPDLGACMRSLAAAGDRDYVDESRARWVFPALAAPDATATSAAAEGPSLPDGEAVAAASRALAAAREGARERQGRRFGGPASDEAHKELEERLAERRTGEGRGSADRLAVSASSEVARAVGTAIHRALEDFDLDAEPAAEIARQRDALEPTLQCLLAGEALEQALAEARALLERFASGPLFAKLLGLAERVIARELPVLVPPQADRAPVTYLSGAIDLVYRDPETEELVVADYKTDRVEDRAALNQRTQVYATQGAVYQRALEQAFGLSYTPRFELWYLSRGEVA